LTGVDINLHNLLHDAPIANGEVVAFGFCQPIGPVVSVWSPSVVGVCA